MQFQNCVAMILLANCATFLRNLKIVPRIVQFQTVLQIDNVQIVLRNLQTAQSGKMRGTYIHV